MPIKPAFLIAALFLMPLVSHAEPDPGRGKLPDGRAFRTDAEGNQIVDYIAELEVAIEGLNRRIYSLEDEVKDKDFEIQRLSKGLSPSGAIKERQIDGISQGSAVVSEAACSSYISRARTAAEQESKSMSEDAEVEKQLSERRAAELRESKSRLESAISALEEKGTEILALKRKLSESEARLVSLQDTVKEAQEGKAAAWRERDEQQARASQLAKQREEELRRIEDLKKDNDVQLAAQLEILRREKEEFKSRQAASGSYQNGNLDTARTRAVDSVRDRVSADLNQLRSLIGSRDEIYSEFKKKKHSLAFIPFKPVSETGNSLPQIASDLKTAQTVSEVAKLGRQISWIQSRINDDINLMQRIEKIGGAE